MDFLKLQILLCGKDKEQIESTTLDFKADAARFSGVVNSQFCCRVPKFFFEFCVFIL